MDTKSVELIKVKGKYYIPISEVTFTKEGKIVHNEYAEYSPNLTRRAMFEKFISDEDMSKPKKSIDEMLDKAAGYSDRQIIEGDIIRLKFVNGRPVPTSKLDMHNTYKATSDENELGVVEVYHNGDVYEIPAAFTNIATSVFGQGPYKVKHRNTLGCYEVVVNFHDGFSDRAMATYTYKHECAGADSWLGYNRSAAREEAINTCKKLNEKHNANYGS